MTTNAPDELKLKQVNELLQTHLVRRKVDPRVLEVKSSEGASGGSIRQVSELKEGISQENAKKVIADIKKLKLKIQIKIQGDELRVDGKKKIIFKKLSLQSKQLILVFQLILLILETN